MPSQMSLTTPWEGPHPLVYTAWRSLEPCIRLWWVTSQPLLESNHTAALLPVQPEPHLPPQPLPSSWERDQRSKDPK